MRLELGRVASWTGRRVVGGPRREVLQASPRVERLSVSLEGGEIDLLAKRVTAAEVVALGLLPRDPCFPQLVDSGVDRDGPWAVTTYHQGNPIGWNTEPPAAVYEALARLHLRYVDDPPAGLPVVDADFLRTSFDGFARGGLLMLGADPVRDQALRLLDRCVDNGVLLHGLERLPHTFLHGDVHGDNVIVDGGGRPALIDWGSARIGPAMLDVMLAAGPSGTAAYGEAVQGTVLEPTLPLGRAWATVVNNAMFVGAAAQRSLQVAGEMVDEAESALEELGELLEIG